MGPAELSGGPGLGLVVDHDIEARGAAFSAKESAIGVIDSQVLESRARLTVDGHRERVRGVELVAEDVLAIEDDGRIAHRMALAAGVMTPDVEEVAETERVDLGGFDMDITRRVVRMDRGGSSES